MKDIYNIPKQPVYDPEIQKLQDADPASASQTFNPLFQKMIENTAAVKMKAEESITELREAVKDLEEASGGIEEAKGQPGGLATLDEEGKIPVDQLPPMDYDKAGAAVAVQSNLDSHKKEAGLHANVEKQSKWDTGVTTAGEAKADSAAAQITANEAKTAAGMAQTTADEAKAAAGTAQTTADQAKTAAEEAKATARSGDQVYQNALRGASYYVNPYRNRVEIKSSQKWICPAEVTQVGCMLVGGGAGGGSSSGGCGGFTTFSAAVPVIPGASYPIQIGDGGKNSAEGSSSGVEIGGDTTAFGLTAAGGTRDPEIGGGSGGCCGSSQITGNPNGGANGSMGGGYYSGGYYPGQGFPTMDPYSGILYSGGGGGLCWSAKFGRGGAGGGGDYKTDGKMNTGGGGGAYGSGGSGIVVIYY